MTERSRGIRPAALTRAAFVAGPLCMLAYGAIRLSDPEHGPGLAWTAGHLALIAGVVLFGVAFPGLRRLAEPAGTAGRVGAATATVLGLAGTLAVVAQAVIDLVVGFRSADRADMNRLFDQVQSHPGVMPVVYTVGPLLFYVGLVWLVVQLAVRRRVGPWCPALVVLGTATMAVSLDLIPVGAALYAAAFAPLARGDRARIVPA
ncbi:hypothetical protein [Streptomyces sp. ISL-11]|uniref:hypothetical protein n=1 Tax=Streptomyces sp. ISL-11 TaxID=2819174 RepID=UPI001BE58DFD|nr:hypothetical protein [Streptomyces sp. ISL-11]MBT2386948.1 hypothetical protein [Streptomyces sp. ISL-11]